MTNIKDFAKSIRDRNPDCKKVYIAIMPSAENNYLLEIEISPREEIAGSYYVNSSDLDKVRRLADRLDNELNSLGFEVVKDRKEWEDQ